MSEPAPSKRFSPWNHWYRRALPAYWIFLFCVTHFPKLTLDIGIPEAGALAHIGAFAVLAFLYWRFIETFSPIRSVRFMWGAAFWIGLYAAFDEWLQPFVNRTGDVWDWACDMLGAAIVLALLEWRRRRLAADSNASIPAKPLDSPTPKR